MTSAKSDYEIKIQFAENFTDISYSTLKLRKLVKFVCMNFGKKESLAPERTKTKYEISITVVNDFEFKKINQRFLGRKSLSDCLSFDLSDNKPGSPKIFELIINGQMALRQADLWGHSAQAELALYVTHGLLHNFGFDDATEVLAQNMHEKEDEILQELGYGLVYNNEDMNSKEDKNRKKRKYKK